MADHPELAKALKRAPRRAASSRGCARTARRVQLENLWSWITKNGDLADDAKLIDEIIRDSAILGTIPADTTLASMREKGAVRAVGWGNSAMMVCQQSPIEPNKTHTPVALAHRGQAQAVSDADRGARSSTSITTGTSRPARSCRCTRTTRTTAASPRFA